ncbi:maleylpyruvate isomerase family mycothiol-dependent enzyme [Nocardioides euryhalodurans]|uniref:Maleylpyruvate isomerase family mycothiol-dependent enzyme n=1 Tax=Nocardioides euryhalodurans TaxID=2518370 RepID=A0A4P7GLH7_9ACTN|nr:maleylpyruvate isomerase family mycothiol-dependent enzyme [Nocardioides euryhalodurans]QBR92998.1 maleylpyruvate isomerase family mycothiol-dependent enzyme [Nocardioides euryhalodurans]
MDKEAVWDVVVSERHALLEHLRVLTPEEWDHPSLCAGWRVRDVAAHVISAPQLRWRATGRVMTQMWRGYNGAILRDGLQRGAAPTAEILAQYDRWAGVRRGPLTVTHVEPLVDVLVHSQDILRPLGRVHVPPPEAAVVAADRSRLLAPLVGSTRTVRRVRMRATDTEWERGRGPVVEGPALELLMLCAGREAEATLLAGEGVEVITPA